MIFPLILDNAPAIEPRTAKGFAAQNVRMPFKRLRGKRTLPRQHSKAVGVFHLSKLPGEKGITYRKPTTSPAANGVG